MAPPANPPDTLQTAALLSIADGFFACTKGKAATFTCGGSVALPKPAHVVLPGAESFTFPGSEDISPLVNACSIAHFGKGKTKVDDPSYRKALALDLGSFVTDVSQPFHNMLSEVERVASVVPGSINAELYKLNIHQPGDFFKPHLDTPRSGNVFGTLVICLPYSFQGGDLVVRHQRQAAHYKWASQAVEQSVTWAFFYADCEHEILPVTSGLRITLAFNLAHTPAQQRPCKPVDPLILPFGLALKAALDCTVFMPNGGELGFALQHLYPHTAEGFEVSMLKGADAVVLSVAECLGLKTTLEPVWQDSDEEADFMFDSSFSSCDRAGLMSGGRPGWMHRWHHEGTGSAVGGKLGKITFVDEYMNHEYGDSRVLKQLHGHVKGVRDASNVLWIHADWKLQLGLVGLSYGNEPSLQSTYSACAMIIQVPAVSDRRYA